MTQSEQERRDDARARHKTTPPTEHVTFRPYDDKPWASCIRCGYVKPTAGWPEKHRTCSGPRRIGLR